MILTKGELRRREEAVVAGFIERDGDKAFEHVQELIKVSNIRLFIKCIKQIHMLIY